MIRNVFDNDRQVNPYTTRETNLRLGKFYSNSLKAAGAANDADRRGNSQHGFVSVPENKFWL